MKLRLIENKSKFIDLDYAKLEAEAYFELSGRLDPSIDIDINKITELEADYLEERAFLELNKSLDIRLTNSIPHTGPTITLEFPNSVDIKFSEYSYIGYDILHDISVERKSVESILSRNNNQRDEFVRLCNNLVGMIKGFIKDIINKKIEVHEYELIPGRYYIRVDNFNRLSFYKNTSDEIGVLGVLFHHKSQGKYTYVDTDKYPKKLKEELEKEFTKRRKSRKYTKDLDHLIEIAKLGNLN